MSSDLGGLGSARRYAGTVRPMPSLDPHQRADMAEHRTETTRLMLSEGRALQIALLSNDQNELIAVEINSLLAVQKGQPLLEPRGSIRIPVNRLDIFASAFTASTRRARQLFSRDAKKKRRRRKRS